MNYKISHTLEDAQKLKEGWKELYNQLPELSPFQSYEFNYYSWQYFLKNEGELFILSFYEANKLVAIFPTYIDRSKTLRFINDIHVDFCDILNNSTTPFKLFKTVEKIVSESAQISSVQLINLENESTASQLNYHFKKRKSLKSIIQHSVLEITGGELKESLKHLTSNERGKLKRLQKLNNDYTFYFNDDFNKSDILKLREEMVRLGKRNHQFLNGGFLSLIVKMKEKDFLQISSLKSNKLLAVSFVLKRANKYLIWVGAYENKPFLYLAQYIHILEHLKAGDTISFGRGTYDYKMRNFNPVMKNLYVFKYNKTYYGFIIHSLQSFTKSIVKSLLKKKQY